MGRETLSKWDGSENLPLRGEKTFVLGGRHQSSNVGSLARADPSRSDCFQAVSTLDFTATALKLAGGEIPPEFDGVDLMPVLTNTSKIERSKDLFWDWGDGIALQRDGWKIHRFGKKLAMFRIHDDPNEYFDLQLQEPLKFEELQSALMARYKSLPESGRSPSRHRQRSRYQYLC